MKVYLKYLHQTRVVSNRCFTQPWKPAITLSVKKQCYLCDKGQHFITKQHFTFVLNPFPNSLNHSIFSKSFQQSTQAPAHPVEQSKLENITLSNLALRDAPVLALPHRATGGTHLGNSEIFPAKICRTARRGCICCSKSGPTENWTKLNAKLCQKAYQTKKCLVTKIVRRHKV